MKQYTVDKYHNLLKTKKTLQTLTHDVAKLRSNCSTLNERTEFEFIRDEIVEFINSKTQLIETKIEEL